MKIKKRMRLNKLLHNSGLIGNLNSNTKSNNIRLQTGCFIRGKKVQIYLFQMIN